MIAVFEQLLDSHFQLLLKTKVINKILELLTRAKLRKRFQGLNQFLFRSLCPLLLDLQNLIHLHWRQFHSELNEWILREILRHKLIITSHPLPPDLLPQCPLVDISVSKLHGHLNLLVLGALGPHLAHQGLVAPVKVLKVVPVGHVAQEEGLSGRHIDGGQLRGQGGGERASVIVLGVVNSVTPEVLAPGGPAQRTINEALDEPLFDLVLVFGLDIFRYIFPVPETEHLHGVEEPRVLPHIPVPDHLVQILVSVQQETRSPPPLVLNYGRLRKDGKVSIV